MCFSPFATCSCLHNSKCVCVMEDDGLIRAIIIVKSVVWNFEFQKCSYTSETESRHSSNMPIFHMFCFFPLVDCLHTQTHTYLCEAGTQYISNMLCLHICEGKIKIMGSDHFRDVVQMILCIFSTSGCKVLTGACG